MHALERAGVVEMRGRSGIFLKDLEVDGYYGHTVGIVCWRLPSYPWGSLLQQSIDFRFHDLHYRVMHFIRNDGGLARKDGFSLFPGLRRSLANKTIEALLTLVPLEQEVIDYCEEQGIPVCYYGPQEGYPNTVFISPVTDDAVRRLAEAGYRRPAIVLSPERIKARQRQIAASLRPFHGDAWQNYCWSTQTDELSPPPQDKRQRIWNQIGDAFLKMSPQERPDSLVIPDDFLANHFILQLLSSGIQPPPIIGLFTRQIPISRQSSHLLGWYEIDLEQLALLTVNLTTELISAPEMRQKTRLLYTPIYTTPP